MAQNFVSPAYATRELPRSTPYHDRARNPIGNSAPGITKILDPGDRMSYPLLGKGSSLSDSVAKECPYKGTVESAHQGINGEGQYMRNGSTLKKLTIGVIAIFSCMAVLSTSCTRLTNLMGGKAVPSKNFERSGTERRVPLPPTVQDFEDRQPEPIENRD